MDTKTFRDSLTGSAPPDGLSNPAKALWHAARSEWSEARQHIKEDTSREAAWVRAYFHRAKGNTEKANKWYAEAGKSPAQGPLNDELMAIAAGLLMGPGGH